MAELKPGRIVEWHRLSPTLSLFRVVGAHEGHFPSYQAGQYIALRRDDCLLTRKVKDGEQIRYVPDLDDQGKQKRGPVTHSYSISSAPYETEEGNYLEFYVVLEMGRFDTHPTQPLSASMKATNAQAGGRASRTDSVIQDEATRDGHGVACQAGARQASRGFSR